MGSRGYSPTYIVPVTFQVGSLSRVYGEARLKRSLGTLLQCHDFARSTCERARDHHSSWFGVSHDEIKLPQRVYI